MEITQEELKSLVTYSEGKLYWKPGKGRGKTLNCEEAGSIHKYRSGDRCRVYIINKKYMRSRLVFLYFNGYMPKFVDHKDKNSLNDKIENLRPATASENMSNRKSHKDSFSKYLGVAFCYNKYWVATINKNKVCTYLGTFKTEIEAAKAYNKAAVLMHGEFANLNVIEE